MNDDESQHSNATDKSGLDLAGDPYQQQRRPSTMARHSHLSFHPPLTPAIHQPGIPCQQRRATTQGTGDRQRGLGL